MLLKVLLLIIIFADVILLLNTLDFFQGTQTGSSVTVPGSKHEKSE